MPLPKLTASDRVVDRFSLFIFLGQLVLVVIFGAVGVSIMNRNYKDERYLDIPEDRPWYDALVIPARFLLLNSTMIPISLKVRAEL